jgi:hypothetical protein
MSFTSMYRNVWRGKQTFDRDFERRSNKGFQQLPGMGLACHSKEPPPAADYQRWLDENRSKDPRGKLKLTGEKLRRAVRMIRNGYSKKKAGEAISCRNMHKWIPMLPPELAP